MSLAGFDFQGLNRRYMAQPANDATNYGVSVVKAPTGPAWRCIGVYHLAPSENRGKHNVFVDVLDEKGNRTRDPVINWTWYMDAPTQTVRLDKPDNEPATDIPVQASYTVTLRVNGGGLPSDSVGNIHTRHGDEYFNGEKLNYTGHHSFYVVFQRQGSAVITPPDPVDPPVKSPSTNVDVAALQAQIGKVQRELTTLEAMLIKDRS